MSLAKESKGTKPNKKPRNHPNKTTTGKQNQKGQAQVRTSLKEQKVRIRGPTQW